MSGFGEATPAAPTGSAGLPTTVVSGVTSSTTTAPAPTDANSPTVIGPITRLSADGRAVLDRRVALFAAHGRAAEGDTVVQEHVVADFGRLPDDDADPVVDEHALADLRGGVDLDAGQEPRDVGVESGEQRSVVRPEPWATRRPVGSPATGTTSIAPRRRVLCECCTNICFQSVKHGV